MATRGLVAAKIMIGDGIMPGGRAVVASQPVAPIIARAALLRQTRGWLEGAGVGVHAEIAATDIYLQGKGGGGPASPQSPARGAWGGQPGGGRKGAGVGFQGETAARDIYRRGRGRGRPACATSP